MSQPIEGQERVNPILTTEHEVDADLCEYEIDVAATERERAKIRAARCAWLEGDPASVAAATGQASSTPATWCAATRAPIEDDRDSVKSTAARELTVRQSSEPQMLASIRPTRVPAPIFHFQCR